MGGGNLPINIYIKTLCGYDQGGMFITAFMLQIFPQRVVFDPDESKFSFDPPVLFGTADNSIPVSGPVKTGVYNTPYNRRILVELTYIMF